MAEVIVRYKDGRQYGVEESAVKKQHPDAEIIAYADGKPYKDAVVAEDDPINTPVQRAATKPG